ncbi:MAG: hypothetical protein AAGG08_19300 [Actinomycetota bacterium]
MIFGDSVRAATSSSAAEWIAGELTGRPGTIGALVPDRYERLLRLHPPPETPDDWWDRYRDVFALVASLGARHTSTPQTAWYAVWEGHGFDNVSTSIVWSEPPEDDAERHRRDAQRARLRTADQRRTASIKATLGTMPRFDLPHRAYYLLHGPLAAVTELTNPTDHSWHNPDMFWPEDRTWFAATDCDFWSLYVGGSAAFIDELIDTTTTVVETVTADDHVPIED